MFGVKKKNFIQNKKLESNGNSGTGKKQIEIRNLMDVFNNRIDTAEGKIRAIRENAVTRGNTAKPKKR